MYPIRMSFMEQIPEKNSGRYGWRVACTLCSVKVQGTFAEKAKNCSKCEFYTNVKERKEVILLIDISFHPLKPFKIPIKEEYEKSQIQFHTSQETL